MKDTSLTQHYQQILGDTDPWVVSEVRLDVERQQRDVVAGFVRQAGGGN
jgi:hypothetical protein